MRIVDLVSVSVSFGKTKALDDISLQIDTGERIVILGPSGCGKTTILRLLAGFITPDSGSVSLGGELVACDRRLLKPPEQRDLGLVFQDLALWPHLTVGGNIEFGLKARGLPRPERKRLLDEALTLVGLRDYAGRKPAALSGGQQQRVALARALVLTPGLLLLDEPLSSLDLELNIRLRHEILRLHEKLGFTLVHVTHDRDEAFALGTRVVVVARGRIERDGSVADIRKYYQTGAPRAE